MKPVTAPDDLEFELLPTFDQLKEESGWKLARLRVALSSVPCWKCSDNTVRYDAAAAAEAISGAAAEVESEESSAVSVSMLKTDGGVSMVLLVLNKVLGILGSQQKEKNETIKAMGEPLRVGVEMLQKAAERLEKRSSELEENRDRVFKLIEEALTARNDRELAQKREESLMAIRAEMVAMVKDQVPSIVQKWALTTQASKAVEFMQSVDPALIETIVASGALEPHQLQMLQELRASMKVAAPAEPTKEAPNGNQQI